MEALSYEAGFYTLAKTLGDWRNTRVKWNARTAMKEGLKKLRVGCHSGILCMARSLFKFGKKTQTILRYQSNKECLVGRMPVWWSFFSV